MPTPNIYIYIYIVSVKSLEILLFLVPLKEVSYAHLACIYSNIVNIITI